MPKSYWTKIQTPNGLKYFRADDVTDGLMQKIRDEADDVFYAEYGVTSFDDIKAAYDAGKKVCAVRTVSVNTYVYELVAYVDNQALPNLRTFIFTCLDLGTQMTIFRYPSNWDSLPDKSFADNNDLLALIQSIAPSYDSIPCPIEEGTYAMNGSTLYRANTTITSEETYASWNPEQWDAVTVGGRLKRLDDEMYKNVAYVDILQTPFSEVLALYNQGQDIVARYGNEFYRMIGYNEAYGVITGFSFQKVFGPVIHTWSVTSDGPSETNNWVTPPSIIYNALIGTSAAPYDETSTYSVGDVVSHYSDLYRCTTDIDVAESWTPAHWTQTTVADELKRVESSSKIAVFECRDNGTTQDFFTGPTYAELEAARTAGKAIVLLVHYGFDTVNDKYFVLTNFDFGRNYFTYQFTNSNDGSVLKFEGPDTSIEYQAWSRGTAYDNALSSTSANAVQNKTLYAIINDLQTRVSVLEGN